MKTYKVADLMQRYNIGTPQGIRKFVKSNLDKINSKGEHAKIFRGEWVFDEEAVRIMDELRDTNSITIIEENAEQLEELRKQNEQLRNLLLATQARLIETQEELIKTQSLLVESQKQLSNSEQKIIANREQLTESKITLKDQKAMIEELKTQLQQGLEAIETLKKLKQRNFFERLLDKDFDK